MDNRKPSAIILTLAIMTALAGGAYFFLRQKKQAEPKKTQVGPKLTQVTTTSAISPIASLSGGEYWFFNSKGQLFYIQPDGTGMNENNLPELTENLKRAFWPKTGFDFIVSTSVKAGQEFKYFNAETRQFKLLPANIQSLDYLPDGKRIAYIWLSDDGLRQQLMVANADASGFKPVKDVFWPDLSVEVSPDGKHALLVRTNIQATNKIYLVNLDTGEFTTVIDAGKNLETEWASADTILYVQDLGNNKRTLKTYNLLTAQSKDLNIDTVLDKVVVDATGKYAYADILDGTIDAIWKIDLSTMDKQKIYEFDEKIKPFGLFLNNQTIGFTNALDGTLYTLIP